ncbi:membrane protein, partial [Trifolium medium]|nr:membrane protein [Trifolium medium]MCI28324.1 membrane protein [Trifolium medium]
GILIRTLADATNESQSLTAQQIIFNALGFCLTVATTVIITVYAKRRLKELQEEDKMLLQ